MLIRPLRPSDFPMMIRHRTHHSAENGRDGDVIFAPSEDGHPITEAELKRDAEALEKSVTETGWLRIWILTDETEIYGALTLINQPPMKSALHRCLLMMGLERPVRGQGHGSKLMETAIDWAKHQTTLDWITLFVFENNPPAKALYKKFNFETVGTTKDMFRVFGQSIDDTEMVLKLR